MEELQFSNKIIGNGKYRLLENIGQGAFGIVSLQVLSNQSEKYEEICFRREIEHMEKINHINFVKLTEVISEDFCYLVMELASGGDFRQYLRNKNGKLTEEEALYFMKQIIDGLHVLYKLKILHRDLKPENFLLSDQGPNPILKICDLGFSKSISEETAGKTNLGTRYYKAFEIIKGNEKYNYKADL